MQGTATSCNQFKRLDNIPAYYKASNTDSRTDTPTSWAQGLFRDIRGLRVRVVIGIRTLSDKKEDIKKGPNITVRAYSIPKVLKNYSVNSMLLSSLAICIAAILILRISSSLNTHTFRPGTLANMRVLYHWRSFPITLLYIYGILM